uniref:Fibrinogen C-terminal domain-containing protein n=1 Tax=Amphimedon queenslandica TaxID=400682 RepID=A0A1X7TV93_AMPQE
MSHEKEGIYDETELQEYEGTHRYKITTSIGGQDTFTRILGIITAILQVIALLLLIVILSIVAGTLSRFNSIDVCESTAAGPTPTTGASVGTVPNITAPVCNVSCNCLGDSTWTGSQVETLVNGSLETGRKLNDLLSYTGLDGMRTMNITQTLKLILEGAQDSTIKLSSIINGLANVGSSQYNTNTALHNIYLITQEILSIQNSTLNISIPIAINSSGSSCSAIKSAQPDSTSGFYTINGYSVYCNMDQTLCGSAGGWSRIAYLDMSDSTQNCPSGFRLYNTGGVRACGRPISFSAGCSSIEFSSNGISYSQICGRVQGYQFGSTDAVHPTDGPAGHQNNIDSYYADGVLLTRGSPRQHVWTFIAGYTETSDINANSNCPCANGVTTSVPSFVGNDYYCESGNGGTYTSEILYTNDTLWDGQTCGNLERPCCLVSDIPWFHRSYGSNSYTDNIQMRVCGDEGTNNEDNPVGLYEIYVK